MAKVKKFNTKSGVEAGYEFKCPACKISHHVFTNGEFYEVHWGFNGDVNKPTFKPSVRIEGFDWESKENYMCHFFIKEGKIQFCGDCSHELAGQTVEMEEIKEE